MRLIKRRFAISGMQCDECALHVEDAVQNKRGVLKAEGDFASESVALEYDSNVIRLSTLRAAIQKAGYDLAEIAAENGSTFKRIAAISAGLLGIALLLYLDRWVQIDLPSPTVQTQADYGILFLIGVLTSFHCIGMCGGFVLGYTAAGSGRGWAGLPRHLAYGLGKTLSYTSFGALFGVLGGFLAFTPLQAMYILAAGTGSAWQGAAMLFFFALGTLPVMLAFGFFASMITAATSKKMLQVSGLLIQNGYQVVYMEVHDDKLQPSEFVIKKNYPVKWIIDVKKLSPCNKQLVIPSLQKTIDLHPGLQMVEFLPEQAGAINWSCSMGMMSGSFKVVD